MSCFTCLMALWILSRGMVAMLRSLFGRLPCSLVAQNVANSAADKTSYEAMTSTTEKYKLSLALGFNITFVDEV